MKKRFIFSLLAIFLAGLGFGGISLAATACSDGVQEKQDGHVAYIDSTYYCSLGSAIEAAEDGSVTNPVEINILGDFSFTTVNNGKYIKLNLGGQTINGGLDLYNGFVTISNGTLKREGKTVVRVETSDDNEDYNKLLVDSDAKLEGDYAIIINSENDITKGYGASVEIRGEVEGSTAALWIMGNIKLGNSVVDVYGNLSGHLVGLAQQGQSVLNIYEGASIYAGTETALEIRAGETHINGGTFVSEGDPASVAGNGNGTTTVGAALAISQHTTNLPIDVTVNGGTFNGVNALIITNPEGNDIYGDGHKVEVAVNGGIFNGNIVSENQKDGADPLGGFIAGGTFNNPIKKIHITDETKCTVKTSAGMYEVGVCPVSIIRHDSDSDLEGTSPEATITVNGYNATVSGPINFYNKALNQGGGNRYGLEIVSEGFESTLIGDATYTLNGAHWNNVAGDYELGEFGHDYSWFAYPKLTEDNKSNPLTITINWGDYYPIETFTITHGDVELRGITVTFDTDGGTEISDKVFSGSDFDSLPANIKVGDIAIPEKVGYTFANWYLSGDDATSVYDTNSVIEHDITLKANYTPNDVTMTFIVDGESTELAGKVGDTYDKPVPTKSCYTARWTPVLPDVMPTENTTYTLSWSYSCGGGGSSSSSSSSSNKTGDNNTGNTTSGTTADSGANTPTVDPQGVAANGYTNEMNEAYEFAYANGITTMKSIDEAEMLDGLTRIAMAKMLSQYAINVLGKSPADVEVPNFTDVSTDLDAEYANGVSLAYKLGIMGINMPDNKFLPYETVTRAQFGTALSRLLFGIEDGEDAYYTTHLAKLKEAGIITNDDPTLEELRGYVMLMLMRSAK